MRILATASLVWLLGTACSSGTPASPAEDGGGDPDSLDGWRIVGVQRWIRRERRERERRYCEWKRRERRPRDGPSGWIGSSSASGAQGPELFDANTGDVMAMSDASLGDAMWPPRAEWARGTGTMSSRSATRGCC